MRDDCDHCLTGHIEEGVPVVGEDGTESPVCPTCGFEDGLGYVPEHVLEWLLEIAERGKPRVAA